MRKEKELLLNEIKEKIDTSAAMIVTRYDRLPPNASWELRDALAKQGGLFEVVRKKMFVKAAERAGLQVDEGLLKGHVGIVFVNQPDALGAAKALLKFSKDNDKIVEVLYGQIDGKVVAGADVEILAQLPGIDEMRASLLALMTAPMSQLLSVFEAVMREPLSILEQKS